MTTLDEMVDSLSDDLFELAHTGVTHFFRGDYNHTESSLPENLDDKEFYLSQGHMILRGHLIRSK